MSELPKIINIKLPPEVEESIRLTSRWKVWVSDLEEAAIYLGAGRDTVYAVLATKEGRAELVTSIEAARDFFGRAALEARVIDPDAALSATELETLVTFRNILDIRLKDINDCVSRQAIRLTKKSEEPAP